MPKQIRVNIKTQINADSIQIERKPNYKNGDDYTIIKNHLWMIDEIVLNDGLYSREDNQAGYKSMEGRLFTAGHPKVNGKYVTISNQDNPISNEALAKHYTGATTINVRNEGNRYYEDIEINERIANASSDGRDLMAWTDKAEAYIAGNGEKPDNLHTSTGLLLNQKEQQGESRGKSYRWVAKNQNYDHNAYLLRENGAGGDEISLSVNGEGDDIEVMTVNLPDVELDQTEEFTDSQKSWIANQIDKIVRKFTPVIKSNANETTPEGNAMSKLLKEQLTKLGVNFDENATEADLLALHTETVVNQAVSHVNTDVEKQVKEILKANQAEAEKAQKQEIVDKIKANSSMTEDQLMDLPLMALNEMLPKPGKSTGFPRPHVTPNESESSTDKPWEI